MGVDIGIAVYDEARELEYKMLDHLLAETNYLDKKVLAYSPVDLAELMQRKNVLFEARRAAKPTTPLTMEFNGERLANLNVYVSDAIKLTIGEGTTLLPRTTEMASYIVSYNKFLTAMAGDPEMCEFIEQRRDLFVEMNENNLMLFTH